MRATPAAALTLAAALTACDTIARRQEPTMTDRSPAPPAMVTPADRDRIAVTTIVETIARGADLRQWDLVRAVLADRVELDYGTPERLTPADVVDRWRPLLEAFDATQHMLSDVAVTLDGDSARATSRFHATHVLRGAPGGDAWVLTGRYEHDLVRSPAGWKVTRMRMIPGEATGNTGLVDQARARAAGPAGGIGESRDARRDRNRETVRAFFARLEALDTGDGFAALFTDDARQVMPFAPEGFPRLLDGRAAILAQYGGLPDAYTSMRFPDLVIHDMASPDEFFATYRGDIRQKSGAKYDNTYVGRFVLRDGRIAEFTEYFDPIVLARAFGGQLQRTFNVRQ